MATITTELATPDRWDDVQHAITGGGDGPGCQCDWWTLTNAEFQAMTTDERRDVFENEIRTGPPPGVIAYVDGEAAGWARIGPRPAQRRIARTRNIVLSTAEPLDDDSVWAVTCFVVRKEHRGIGLASVMLQATLDLARSAGARLIEAYPIDTAQGKHPVNDLYHGTLSMFLAAGFTVSGERKPGLPLATLDLAA